MPTKVPTTTVSRSGKTGVLFVGLGNICRSPMAEAIFNYLIKQRELDDKWFTDSCGTGDFHLGKDPDPRVIKILKMHGIEEITHKARLITEADLNEFHWILAMDQYNFEQVEKLSKEKTSPSVKIELLGSYSPDDKIITIDDPYYDKNEVGFEHVYNNCNKCLNIFLDENIKK